MKKDVTTTLLEMLSPDCFRPKTLPGQEHCVSRVEIPTPSLNHFFYVNVGWSWQWIERLSWTYSDWRTWATNERVHTFIGYVKGSPFGYFELERRQESLSSAQPSFREADPRRGIEISYFGLLPQFIGGGRGGFLLSEAVRLAWSFKPERVWVHTCTLDHKHALANYQARGFSILKQETTPERILDDDDPIWSTPEYYRSMAQEFRAVVQ